MSDRTSIPERTAADDLSRITRNDMARELVEDLAEEQADQTRRRTAVAFPGLSGLIGRRFAEGDAFAGGSNERSYERSLRDSQRRRIIETQRTLARSGHGVLYGRLWPG